MKQVILIIAAPGHARDGLSALLTTLRHGTVLAYTDGQSASGATENYVPSLVILDTNLPGNSTLMSVKDVKMRWPDTPCLVLVDHVEQRQPAHGAGADATWRKGFPADSLIATIEDLLSR